MVKQIYNHCEDPLFGMLILKTVPLLDVKESPDKIFFGQSLHTNLPRLGMVHAGYEDRYINKEATGTVSSTRNFPIQDPVWIKISDSVPWKKGIIVSVHGHKSYDVQVDGKMYRPNVSPPKELKTDRKLKCQGSHHRLQCRLIFHINRLVI